MGRTFDAEAGVRVGVYKIVSGGVGIGYIIKDSNILFYYYYCGLFIALKSLVIFSERARCRHVQLLKTNGKGVLFIFMCNNIYY